jgi:hypothetical protein
VKYGELGMSVLLGGIFMGMWGGWLAKLTLFHDQWKVLVLAVFVSGLLAYQIVTVGAYVFALLCCALHVSIIKLFIARKFFVPYDYKSGSMPCANNLQGRNMAVSTKFTIHLPYRGRIMFDTGSAVK